MTFSSHLVREFVFDKKIPSKTSANIHNKSLPTNIINNHNYIFETFIISHGDKENINSNE